MLGCLAPINSLPNSKVLDLTNLKAFADDKKCTYKKIEIGCEDNFVGKGKNSGFKRQRCHYLGLIVD